MNIPKDLVELFKEVWEEFTGDNVWDVNRGWCYQFALLLHRVYGDSVVLHMDSGHVWISFNGKYYDSEHLNGCEYPLGYSLCGDQKAFTAQEIEDYWLRNGRSGRVRWDIIEEVINRYSFDQFVANEINVA